ncbi:permease [Frankia sp. QA3]|uniref:permease n=1 Tax=Frankia sp. QA3 TaxID=710111 RepID=UPI000269CBDE|nr:permease [Frankia sp. QA3]EIV95527.1 permease [Frankia sp. QA3]
MVKIGNRPASSAPALPYWTKGDTNAFFGLGINVLVNVIVLSSLCLFVVNIPSDDVFGAILPALGIAMLLGNLFYAYLGRRLAAKEGRDDVTAMPYGPSVPHMFIVVFVIMLPIYLKTKDPVAAWQAGLAWAFIIGIIVVIGAFVGPTIRRYAPRAAMLGTLAGISIAFISMRPAAQMWDAAWIALPVFGLLLIGMLTDLKLPWNLPIGAVALALGTAIGWIGGFMDTPAVSEAAKDIAVSLPTFHFDKLFDGLSDISPLLATAIPLGVYNFTEGMSNVESAASAGDNFNLRPILLADGFGAIIGSALGSPFPPAVYIGHPGWKAAGGRTGYSLATGVVIAVLCFLGLFGLLNAVLPLPAIVPILLYIGLLIGAQAFQVSPKAHGAAVVAAIIPNIASWAAGLIDNTVTTAVGVASSLNPAVNLKVTDADLEGNSVLLHGLHTLGDGAVLAGLVLGSIVAFIIDKRFISAAVASAAGAVLSFIGLIHAEKVEWDAGGGQVALGYLFLAVVCAAWALTKPAPRVPDAEEIALEREHGIPSQTRRTPEEIPPSADAAQPPAADATPTTSPSSPTTSSTTSSTTSPTSAPAGAGTA